MRAAVCGLLIVHASLVVSAAWRYSPTRDEPAHLAAGISHWRFGDFSLYRVNPPLVRMIAVLPVLLAGTEEDWSAFSSRPVARAEFDVGRAFVAANGRRSVTLVFLARLACLPFSLIGACVCYRWANEMYGGPAPGLTALALWCFCPIVLGHAALLTPDVAAASLGAAACYLFWRWLKAPRWTAALIAGGALGLAELTKFTWIVLPPVWALAACVRRWATRARQCTISRQTPPATGSTKVALQLAATFSLALYVVNLGYAFQGTGNRLGDFRFVSRLFKGSPAEEADHSDQRNRFTAAFLARLPLPLPREYLQGIDVQQRDFESPLPSFYRGAWRDRAPWYAYFYALALKLPLGTLALLAFRVAISLARIRANRAVLDDIALLSPPAAVLMAACAHTGLNTQVRYLLPVLPFAFVWAAGCARPAPTSWRPARWLGVALTLWSAGATLANHPHYIAYFNEFARRPPDAPPPLLDSNLDWGQDLLYFEDWLKRRPFIEPPYLAYYGSFNPRALGLNCRTEADGGGNEHIAAPPPPGLYAISVGELWAHRDECAYFRDMRPIDVLGRTIFLYEVTETGR